MLCYCGRVHHLCGLTVVGGGFIGDNVYESALLMETMVLG